MSTAIQWTDETWNPTTGCSRVSEGCRHCFIERTPPFRMHGRKLGDPVQLHPDRLDAPLHWKRPRRVFVNSLSDLFHEDVPDEFIAAVFGIMAVRPDHVFQVLTKRPERMCAWFKWIGERGGIGRYIRSIRVGGDRTIPNFFNAVARTEVVRGKTCRAAHDPWMSVFNAASFHMDDGRLANVWLGVSVEDQKTADERIPLLLQTPAAVRFVSAEPLLGPVDLRLWLNVIPRMRTPVSVQSGLPCGGTTMDWIPSYNIRTGEIVKPLLNWVIAGGESGPGARPCDVAWIRSIVQQCQAAGVPCFVKQLGAKPFYEEVWFDADRGIDGKVLTKKLHLKDKKGGDPCEWPADLRVREWPR